MENRRLNFSAPLLSTRRSPIAKHPPLEIKPDFVSDSLLDQVTKPAAIPFCWEQIPGLPKSSAKPRSRWCELPSMNSKMVIDILKKPDETSNAMQFYREKFHPTKREDGISEGTALLSANCSASNHDSPVSERSVGLIKDHESCVSLPATKSFAVLPRLCFKSSLTITTPAAVKTRPPFPAKNGNSRRMKQKKTVGKVNQLNTDNDWSSMRRSSSPARRPGQRSISLQKRVGTGTQEFVRAMKVPYHRNGVKSQEFSHYYTRRSSCTLASALEKKCSLKNDNCKPANNGCPAFRSFPVPSVPSESWLVRTLPSLPTFDAINGVPFKAIRNNEAKLEKL